jgi:hypothetical protein
VRKTKRTVSETETHRVVTVRGRSMQDFCGACGQKVEMIRLDRAAEALDISVTELRRRLANSEGHCMEAGRCVWVCRSWLSRPPRGG